MIKQGLPPMQIFLSTYSNRGELFAMVFVLVACLSLTAKKICNLAKYGAAN